LATLKALFYGAGAQLTNNACRPQADCLSVWYSVAVSSAVRQFALVSETVATLTSRHRQQIEELQAQLITGKAAQDELDSLLKSGVAKSRMKMCASFCGGGAENCGISIIAAG